MPGGIWAAVGSKPLGVAVGVKRCGAGAPGDTALPVLVRPYGTLRWGGCSVVVGVDRFDRPAVETETYDNKQSAPRGGGGPLRVSAMVVGFEAVRPNAFYPGIVLLESNPTNLWYRLSPITPYPHKMRVLSPRRGDTVCCRTVTLRGGRTGRHGFAGLGAPLRNTATGWLLCCRRGLSF